MRCPNCGAHRVESASCFGFLDAMHLGVVFLGPEFVVSIPMWIHGRLAHDRAYCRHGCRCERCRYEWIPSGPNDPSPNRMVIGAAIHGTDHARRA